MGNLANLLKNPTSQVDTVAALVTAVLLDEEIEGSGSVKSVALTMPTEFAVAGSPITVSGTLAVTKATQAANKVFSGPTTGSAAAPTFRSLVAADLPTPANEAANLIYAGPGTGSAAAPTFRALVSADLPSVVVPTVLYSAAGTPLPAASDALKGATAIVSDATLPTYGGAYTSGGAVIARVLCTGLSGGWVTA
jgi:hypothetical protein